jgi:hypothetical protein
LLLLFFAGPASAHPGWGIVVDDKGTVFYTDLKQVWRIGADGREAIAVPNVHTHELYLNSAGTLYGEHLWYDGATAKWGHYLWELTGGKVVRHAPQEGLRADESFVRDRSGAMYWLEGSRILKRAPGGATVEVASIARRPDTQGEAPGGILALGRDGAVYLASAGDLLRVTPAGQTVRLATGLNEHVWTAFTIQPRHYIMGLAVDPESNVYVANSGARKVKKVARDGKVSVVLSAHFPWSPTGIAIRNGEVYVLEYTDFGGSARVRKLSAGGRLTRISQRAKGDPTQTFRCRRGSVPPAAPRPERRTAG